MTIDATFNERNTMLEAKFGVLSKGEKGDALTFDDLTEEQKAELGNAEIVGNHEKRITNLEKKLAPEYFATDASSAHNKVVPSNACPFALVNKVGGMTYKTDNLIPFPYKFGSTVTKYGITATVQTDRSILVNGTNTLTDSSASVDVLSGFTNNTPLYLSGCPSGGSNTTYRIRVQSGAQIICEDVGNGAIIPAHTEECTVRIMIGIGCTANNLVFRPMLNEGETAKPYSPYFKGLRDTKVAELKSEGANLIPYPFPYKETTATRAGITFTDNGDGSITLNGKNDGTNHSTFRISNRPSNVLHIKSGTYKGSTGVDGVILQLYNGTQYYSPSEGFTLDTDGDFQLYVQVSKNTATVFENTVIYPMMNYGTTAVPYKPYVGTLDTLPISAELRAFLEDKGYGRGVEGYPNHIDFERKVFVQNTIRRVLDGTENYIPSSTNTEGKYRMLMTSFNNNHPINVSNSILAPIICNHYKTISKAKTYTCNNGCSCSNAWVTVYDEAYNTSDASLWKAHIAELYASGNPLVVEYALETPIEIDISAYLTDENFIEVEGGGVIKAVNEHGFDAPTEIIYMLKEGGAE